MILIEKYLGEFGNRMFQYAYGRLLADRLGCGLACPSVDPLFPNATSVARPQFGGEWTLVNDENSREVFEDPKEQTYQIWGFMQQYDFLREYKQKCLEMFAPEGGTLDMRQEDVVIHVRRGDYFDAGDAGVLDLAWYVGLLKGMKPRHVFVMGRGIDQATRAALERFSPIYTDASHGDDYRLLLSAKRLIMSNSTFCWWGAWLGNATEIWYPIPQWGWFSEKRPHLQKIRPEQDGRYRFIENVKVT